MGLVQDWGNSQPSKEARESTQLERRQHQESLSTSQDPRATPVKCEEREESKRIRTLYLELMNVLQGPMIHVLDVGAISWEEGPFLLHLL